jgi:hypothetical protein
MTGWPLIETLLVLLVANAIVSFVIPCASVTPIAQPFLAEILSLLQRTP